MLPEQYEYTKSRDLKLYEFYSEGPNGRIRKIVSYAYLGTQDGCAYYNLGFGDYDPMLKGISDLTVSDNGDRDKILATVATTVMEFIRYIPDCRIVIIGSTRSRTRLYQMKIAANFHLITEMFEIQCLTKDRKLVRFKRGENFEGFIVKRNVNLWDGSSDQK